MGRGHGRGGTEIRAYRSWSASVSLKSMAKSRELFTHIWRRHTHHTHTHHTHHTRTTNTTRTATRMQARASAGAPTLARRPYQRHTAYRNPMPMNATLWLLGCCGGGSSSRGVKARCTHMCGENADSTLQHLNSQQKVTRRVDHLPGSTQFRMPAVTPPPAPGRQAPGKRWATCPHDALRTGSTKCAMRWLGCVGSQLSSIGHRASGFNPVPPSGAGPDCGARWYTRSVMRSSHVHTCNHQRPRSPAGQRTHTHHTHHG